MKIDADGHRSIDLRGLSNSEIITRSAELIDAEQEASLVRYEIRMIDAGTDREDIDAELVRYRGELAGWRKEALARLRGWLEHGCETLQ